MELLRQRTGCVVLYRRSVRRSQWSFITELLLLIYLKWSIRQCYVVIRSRQLIMSINISRKRWWRFSSFFPYQLVDLIWNALGLENFDVYVLELLWLTLQGALFSFSTCLASAYLHRRFAFPWILNHISLPALFFLFSLTFKYCTHIWICAVCGYILLKSVEWGR